MSALTWLATAVIFCVSLHRIWATRNLAESIGGISGRLATRHLGQLPGDSFLSEIVASIETANQSITIACDFPGYGMLGNYNLSRRYVTTLQQKAETLATVKILVLDERQRSTLLDLYFPKTKDIEELVSAEALEVLRTRHPSETIKSSADLRRVVPKDQQAAWRELSDLGAHELPVPMPLYLWIVDDRVAVFSIQFLKDGEAQETGFQTRDLRLIRQLQRVFESYWDERKR